MRSPARPHVFVRLRSTTRPGMPHRPARASRSSGTASMNASSTTKVRPGRASSVIVAAGCSTDVGFVGLPITTRSASSGTDAGSSRKPSSGREQDPADRVPRLPQRRLRLRELRVDDDGAAYLQGAREQDEGLGRARRQQYSLHR